MIVYRVARKQWTCWFCSTTIKPGRFYCDHGENESESRVRECASCACIDSATGNPLGEE
jgi:hypothetical protein